MCMLVTMGCKGFKCCMRGDHGAMAWVNLVKVEQVGRVGKVRGEWWEFGMVKGTQNTSAQIVVLIYFEFI